MVIWFSLRELSLVPTGYTTPWNWGKPWAAQLGSYLSGPCSQSSTTSFSLNETLTCTSLCLREESHSAQSSMGVGGKWWPHLAKIQVRKTPACVPFGRLRCLTHIVLSCLAWFLTNFRGHFYISNLSLTCFISLWDILLSLKDSFIASLKIISYTPCSFPQARWEPQNTIIVN